MNSWTMDIFFKEWRTHDISGPFVSNRREIQGAPQSDEWIPNAWTHQQVEPQDNWFLNGSNIQLNVGFFKNKRNVWQIEFEFFPMTSHRHLITFTVHIYHFKMYLPSFGNWKHFSFYIYIYIHIHIIHLFRFPPLWNPPLFLNKSRSPNLAAASPGHELPGVSLTPRFGLKVSGARPNRTHQNNEAAWGRDSNVGILFN